MGLIYGFDFIKLLISKLLPTEMHYDSMAICPIKPDTTIAICQVMEHPHSILGNTKQYNLVGFNVFKSIGLMQQLNTTFNLNLFKQAEIK